MKPTLAKCSLWHAAVTCRYKDHGPCVSVKLEGCRNDFAIGNCRELLLSSTQVWPVVAMAGGRASDGGSSLLSLHQLQVVAAAVCIKSRGCGDNPVWYLTEHFLGCGGFPHQQSANA